MTWKEILAELHSKPTVSIPTAGQALAELSKNGSYEAARQGRLGVPVFEVGGRKRVPSVAILRKLGLGGCEAGDASPDIKRIDDDASDEYLEARKEPRRVAKQGHNIPRPRTRRARRNHAASPPAPPSTS